MVISGVDKKETNILKKRQQRQIEESKREAKKWSTQETDIVSGNCNEELVRESSPETHSVTEASPTNPPLTEAPSTSRAYRNRLMLPTVAKVCDRYGLSTRSAAAVASAVLADVGLVSSKDSTLVIDKNKIHRAVSKSRKEALEDIGGIAIKSIYFDGRKDKTLINEKIGARYHRKEIFEEHISILAEPGSIYLGHTTPGRGTAKGIFTSITTFLESQGWNLDDVLCIGCDGTATNTGWKEGVIQYLEEFLKRPLQWCICMLHANELPLRHLFLTLDGCTSGPREYSGPIGKQLADCESKTTVSFCAVAGNMPDLPKNVVDELSTDQKYLY